MKLREIAKQILSKILRALLKGYRKSLMRKKIFIERLYLETKEKIDPKAKVEVFGNFTKKPWNQRITCHYDPFFKCFKSDLVKI